MVPFILKFIFQQDVLELPWLILAFDLAVLDCWSEELIERVFSRDFLYGFLKRSNDALFYILQIGFIQL